MKLTVIGFWGAYPGAGGATSGYLLQAEGYNILLDCGSGVLSKLPDYISVNELDSVVLSHYHPDHVADVGVLQHAVIVQKGIEKRKKLLTFYGHSEDHFFEKLSLPEYTEGKGYIEGRKYRIGPFTFTFVRTPHPVTAFSMRIEHKGKSIGYTGDTQWNENLLSFFKDVDLLLCEASLFTKFKGAVSGHLAADEAGRLATQTHSGNLILTHLPHYGDHTDLLHEAEVEFKGPIELAAEGKIWDI